MHILPSEQATNIGCPQYRDTTHQLIINKLSQSGIMNTQFLILQNSSNISSEHGRHNKISGSD